MSDQGCILIDLNGLELTSEEKQLLQHPVCAGVIFFSRNFKDISQFKALVSEIRQIFPNALLAVDQEGGRVQRFREGFTKLPPLAHWGESFQENAQACLKNLSATFQTMAKELRAVGINLNLTPVLDLNHGISEVIGERSLHRDPNLVIQLGQSIIHELHQAGLPAVGKHFPGHGAVTVDSHEDLPIDKRTWEELWENDMRPFVALSQQLDAIMPAHIIFSTINENPVTFSPFWLKEILRQKLNFQGVIISDDLTMGAAAKRGSYKDRALQAFNAGCDLLLICNNRAGAIEGLESLLPCQRQEAALRIDKLKSKNMLS